MIKRLIGIIVLFSIITFSQPAWSSGSWNGMDVVRYCTGDTVLFDDSICRAYIQGVVDTHERLQSQGKQTKHFCLPKDKEKREWGEATVPKWLSAFSERLHQKPEKLVLDALKDIFPCQ